MPLPTIYTEPELAAYMITTLADVATALMWTAGTSQIAEAVSDALIGYGVDTISEATGIKKLRAYARWEAWKAAARSLAARVNQDADGAKFDLSKLYDQAVKERDQAEADVEAIITAETPVGSDGLYSSSARLYPVW